MSETLTRRPEWLKVRLPGGPNFHDLSGLMRTQTLHTVCEEARCPNIGECWERRTATFLVLGNVCTRNCGYCAIMHGLPTELDLAEPERVAEAVDAMGLRHAVITSVNRDDLKDGGAGVFAATIRAIHRRTPSCTVPYAVSMMTSVVGAFSRSSASRSRPLPSGRRRSSSTRWNVCSASFRRASSIVPAVVTS